MGRFRTGGGYDLLFALPAPPPVNIPRVYLLGRKATSYDVTCISLWQRWRGACAMEIRTILCSIDFSSVSARILRLATEASRLFSSRLVLHHNVDPPLPSEIPSLQMFLDKVLADEALQRLSSKHQAAIKIERISKPTTSLEERTYLSGQQGHTKECSLSYPHPSSCVQLPELRRCAPLRCPRPYQHLPEPQPRKSQCPCCK